MANAEGPFLSNSVWVTRSFLEAVHMEPCMEPQWFTLRGPTGHTKHFVRLSHHRRNQPLLMHIQYYITHWFWNFIGKLVLGASLIFVCSVFGFWACRFSAWNQSTIVTLEVVPASNFVAGLLNLLLLIASHLAAISAVVMRCCANNHGEPWWTMVNHGEPRFQRSQNIKKGERPSPFAKPTPPLPFASEPSSTSGTVGLWVLKSDGIAVIQLISRNSTPDIPDSLVITLNHL